MACWPRCSIIVPVCNGEHNIADCLESLCGQEYPADRFEIIVVDNNSRDSTAEVVRQYPVRYIQEEKPGSYAARNTGARSARGDILAFTDADCIADPNWLQAISNALSDGETQAVLGFAGGINANIWAELEQAKWEEFWAYQVEVKRIDTRNFAIQAPVLERFGYFRDDVQSFADWELGARLHEAGVKMIFSPDVRVWHINPLTLSEISRRRQRQGYAGYQIMNQHSDAFNETYLSQIVRYHFIDNRQVKGIALSLLLWFLPLLLWPTRVIIEVTTRITRHQSLLYPLFGLWCGLSWEIGILRARREHLLALYQEC
ncbi:MAG: glycosyltransferase [Anaerolineae bacterium]|nr:glycosyltransferase [Anaerolineae bacterium]